MRIRIGAASLGLMTLAGCVALDQAFYEPVAAPPMAPVVLDYRYGWFHTGTGYESILALGAMYQRDPELIASLNQRDAAAIVERGAPIYIPPVHDRPRLRATLEAINADPNLVPQIPPPLEWFEEQPALPPPRPPAASESVNPPGSAAPPRAPRRPAPPSPPPAAGRSTSFRWPVRGRVVRGFSERRGAVHRGIAIAATPGQTVAAARAGLVVYAADLAGYGTAVILDHGDGFFSVYGFLQGLAVRRNQRVRAGETIGAAGRPSRTSDGQVFFQIRINARTVDPLAYLPRTG